MNRFSIIKPALSFLVLASVSALVGCFAETTESDEGSSTNDIVSVSMLDPNESSAGSSDGTGNVNRALAERDPPSVVTVTSAAGCDQGQSEGPHPDPWKGEAAGPHPDPWGSSGGASNGNGSSGSSSGR